MSVPAVGEIACDDLKERLIALEKLLADPLSDCYIERLLDVVIASVNDAQVLPQTKENEYSLAFYKRFAHVAALLQSYRRKPQDFSLIASLGHGAFGRVQLVREVTTGRVCAMKVLKKSRMLTQHTDYWIEREIMARADSPWIVQLYHAFQDVTSLYMVMEYVPGGNLVSWMEEVEIISEAACRFYAAETVLALTDLHAMGFIHRDIKPDNLLLDVGGHVKLADFGTAVRVDPNTRLVHCDAAVGTPDYLSPEVLLSQGAGGGSYGFEVDWWALGVLVYEMLYGDTPFYSETLVNTYAKIMSHTSHLRFPDGLNISELAVDFMKQLLRDRESRLGSGPNGAVRVCSHPWFSPDWALTQKSLGLLDSTDLSLVDWSWTNIRACRAPFQPRLTSETDTSYFQLESDEGDQHYRPTNSPSSNKLEDQLPVSDHTDMRDHSAPVRDAENFLTKFPGVQSAFAGFSFSSPYPSHLSLLSGLHVAPHNFTLSLNAGTSCPPLVNGITTSDSSGPSHPSRRKPDLPSQATPLPPQLHPEQSEQPVLDDPVFFKSQLARVQSQLDDALLMVELHSSEVVNLTQQLEKSETLRRELESQLAQHEASHRITMEEAERRAETVQMEVQTSLARLEAELAEWKAIAQSKQIVRDLQQDTGSTTLAFTTAQLSIRSVEVVDSVSASEMFASMSCATPSILELNRESQTPITTTDTAPSPDHVAHSTLSSPGLVHLNSRSDRVEQLARRAHRAEVLAREAADMLEAEQHFCRLYKETSAEKSDQLKELTRELAETRELLSASQKDSRRYYEECEAARRALDEEQLRSRRHREAARAADERSISASQRAALARREAANLRDSLELMKQAYETEKAKCSAAVNKLTEVMSGSNTGALELMYIASAAQSKDTSGTFYLGNAATRHKLALILGNRQQQQMSNQAREIKRLLNEIKRLNAELAMSKRENLNLQAALAAADRVVDEAHFQRLQHSRENSDDLITMDVQRALPSSFVQARSRSGLFGLGKTQVRSADSGMVLSRCSSTSKSLIGVEREDALASSSSEASTSRATLPRQNSTGEPFSFIGSRTVMQTETSPRIPSPLSPDWGDFTLAGVLEYGRRQPRRKKLFWSPRVVKLTSAHLTVWNYTPDTIGILDSGSRHSSMNRAGHAPTSGTVPPALLEVPLRALYHVRQLDQSDAIHEHPEELATIFNIAYDRFFSDDSPSNNVTMSGVVGVGGQQHSLTLPRKLSFGSSAHFTTVHNPHPPLTDKHPQCSGDSINMRRSVVGSSHGHLDTITSNNSTSRAPSSKAQSISISPHVILVRGHKLHHIRFPRMAVCDLCRKACWQLVSPPPAFQCILCQLKFHATHLNTQDYAIPACGKAIVSLVFRCASSTEREKWVRCIRAAMQFTKMNSPAANPTTATSSADYHSSTAHRCLPLDSNPAATTHEMFAFTRVPSVAAAEVPVPSYSPVFPLDDMLHNGDHSDHSERLSHESSARTVAECQLVSASSTADSGAMATADHCAMNGNHRFDHNGGNHGS